MFRRLYHLWTGTNAVAGIVSRSGGLRVVVGPYANMKYHVGENERLVIVPMAVKGHVSWGAIPHIIKTVTDYVKSQ